LIKKVFGKMPSEHLDAKVLRRVGDINFIRPADLPDGYPNALGVVHGEPPLSLVMKKFSQFLWYECYNMKIQ